MKAILDALKTRLHGTLALTNVIGTRIYLDVGVANAPLPLLIYRATESRVERLMGVTKHTMTFEFEFFFSNSGTQDIHTAAAALATALSTPLTVSGFDRAVFIREEAGAPSFADDSWSITETYRATAFDT
jgi:hypothetical protein